MFQFYKTDHSKNSQPMKTNYIDLALLLLRVGFAGFLLTHGFAKLDMLSHASDFPDPLGVGSLLSLILALIGELVAPVFILIGFKTKWATIPAIITMGVAAFIVKLDSDLAAKEHALLFFFAFFAIFLAGAGKYSVDQWKGR